MKGNASMGWPVIGLGHIALAGKGGIALSGFVAGLGAFVITELFTNKLWVGGVIAAICSVLVALIRTRPRMIESRASAETSVRAQLAKEVAEAFGRVHSVEAEKHKFLQDRIVQQNRLLSLTTITKHAMVEEMHAMELHLKLRGEMLERAGVTCPAVNLRNFTALTRAEDKIRAEIAGINLPEIMKQRSDVPDQL